MGDCKMEEKLIFIPYQDSDNFYSEGILTREFAMLYMLYNHGYKHILNVKKPRTYLDKKKYQINLDFYPEGTVERKVKDILDQAKTIQHLPKFSINQIMNRRGWWNSGYKKTISLAKKSVDNNTLVYSNNPYAVDLLRYLKDEGAKVFFDVMDNFAIHPSLNERERSLALDSYRQIFEFADIISANSQQTCEYMREYTKEISLVKNGVFKENEVSGEIALPQIEKIREGKKDYNRCVGYIGKLGLRLDADLIDSVSLECKDTLFVFVGGYLKGQINNKLLNLFENRKNVLHIDAIPSAYVNAICNEFDVLSIPHSKGENENGGDPLKLYQYLTRNRPIITTSIIGVDEFKNDIVICDDVEGWINFINYDEHNVSRDSNASFEWEIRMAPVWNKLKA